MEADGTVNDLSIAKTTEDLLPTLTAEQAEKNCRQSLRSDPARAEEFCGHAY
jgi:hypothetical protein